MLDASHRQWLCDALSPQRPCQSAQNSLLQAQKEVLQPEEFIEVVHRGGTDAAAKSFYDALACMEGARAPATPRTLRMRESAHVLAHIAVPMLARHCSQSTAAARASVHADILMEEGTEAAISGFCRQHMRAFEDSEENKHEHFAIFQEYVALLESALHARLRERLPGCNTEALRTWLEAQPAESVSSDALDTLLSASDFQAFKQHMLSFKTEVAMASLQPSVRGVVAAPL